MKDLKKVKVLEKKSKDFLHIVGDAKDILKDVKKIKKTLSFREEGEELLRAEENFSDLVNGINVFLEKNKLTMAEKLAGTYSSCKLGDFFESKYEKKYVARVFTISLLERVVYQLKDGSFVEETLSKYGGTAIVALSPKQVYKLGVLKFYETAGDGLLIRLEDDEEREIFLVNTWAYEEDGGIFFVKENGAFIKYSNEGTFKYLEQKYGSETFDRRCTPWIHTKDIEWVWDGKDKEERRMRSKERRDSERLRDLMYIRKLERDEEDILIRVEDGKRIYVVKLSYDIWCQWSVYDTRDDGIDEITGNLSGDNDLQSFSFAFNDEDGTIVFENIEKVRAHPLSIDGFACYINELDDFCIKTNAEVEEIRKRLRSNKDG